MTQRHSSFVYLSLAKVSDKSASPGPALEHGFPVVGIGASAGGLGALRSFFKAVPEKSGIAFVVIVHLDPKHKSLMAELIQTHTSIRVTQVAGATKIEPDQVYVIPPDKDLTVTDGHFRLSERKMPNRSRAPIDGFFRTLAETHSTNAAGIILSGTGSDGTQGIKWIKESGGITMAQSPEESEYRGMPESAIATGHIDVIRPVGQLGPEIVRLFSGNGAEEPSEGGKAASVDQSTIADILSLVRKEMGHDFTGYKQSTINRRIRRRAQFAHTSDLSEYHRLASADRKELRALHDDMLISVTSFFRDPAAFATLEKTVIPRLFRNKQPSDTVRVWIPGCSSGEEAYTVAILLTEHAGRLETPPAIQIFATDLHERGFAVARSGLYAESIQTDMSETRLERFFTREPGGYRVKKLIREKVVFAKHDLLTDPAFSRVDLICCRNLLIYLQRETQGRVMRQFHFALRPGGSLFLGTSESIENLSKWFAVDDKKNRIFRSIDGPDVPRPRSKESTEGPNTSGLQPPASAPGLRAFGTVHRKLLEAYTPPSLVVTGDGEVVHLSEHVGQYLKLGGGEPSNNILDLMPGSLRQRIRKLISEVISTGELSEVRAVMAVDGRKRNVDIVARPLKAGTASQSFVLLVFEEREPGGRSKTKGEPKPRIRTRPNAVRELERELEEAKSQLRIMLEEHETTIEELKASNEELQSINEEEKATEEELEASKEELQSMNEELQTINQEFRSKNEELLEVNSDLVNLMDSTDVGTIFLDKSLRLRRFTPSVPGIFNVMDSDIGRPIADITHSLDYPKLLDDATEVVRTLSRVEYVARSNDNRWYVVRMSPYRSLDDRLDGVVLTMFDSTSRIVAEIERKALLVEVQAASVAKSNFIGVMSHELRTPLNAIVGYADILAAGAVGEVTAEQARHLERIKSSAMHLARMIDDALQSVRIEAGITTLNAETVDVALLTREIAAFMEPLLVAKGLDFQVRAVDGPSIFADATKVRQILFNLLGNAVRYTDKGCVTITCETSDSGAVIVVEDTGIGISRANLKHVFERFWQVDQSKTRLRGGTGLGLMVSRSLARLMGGELDVTSDLGKGSRFELRMPLRSG